MAITINIVQKDSWDHVEYVGPIDAESEVYLEQLLAKLGNKIAFNFRQVEAVNSCGVRSWINFMRELEKTEREIIFEECPFEIVMQINMIPSFKGSAKIESVYGCYICDDCGQEKSLLFEEGKNLPENPNTSMPSVDCPQCGAEMELEELEEEYFAFLAS